MPLSNILYPQKNCQIGFWETTESVEHLKTLCFINDELKETLAKCSPHRQKELLAVRILIAKLLKNDKINMVYDAFRKPYLENVSTQLSVSHSANKVAVILHKTQNIGIDLEHIATKIRKIQSKFMSKAELDFALNNSTQELQKSTLIWSAKESLYKFYGEKELDFKEHLKISPFELTQKGYFIGTIQKNTFHKKLKINYSLYQNHVLTYCIDNSME